MLKKIKAAAALSYIILLSGCAPSSGNRNGNHGSALGNRGVSSSHPPLTPAPTTPAKMDALGQMEVAFEGDYTRDQIKQRLQKAMQLYNVPITEENYSRAGSTLVALRKQNGIREMAILDHMIRSHVRGVNIDFPRAAGLSAAAVKIGDR